MSNIEVNYQLKQNNQFFIGMLFMIFGTVCFASKSIFIKWAYSYGATPEATLFFRQIIATPLFCIILFSYRSRLPEKPTKKGVIKAGIAGLLVFLISPLLDFIGLHYVSAIVERMLVMSYPIFVLIFSFFSKKEKVTIQDVITIIVVSIGIFLSIGGWNLHALNANFFGAFLILLSSAVYGLYLVLSGQLVHKIGNIRMNVYGMSLASMVMVLFLFIRNGLGYQTKLFSFQPSVYVLFSIIAVLTTVVPFLFMLEGIKRIGAVRGSLISMMGPIITIIFGALFLGERLTIIQWIGCFIVLGMLTFVEAKKIRLKMKT
ncbi:DMT family transporter [Bacillus inaquosorum]|uniref:DMT family transporter n=1 Tax=Bacillus TaxID=1386 RepID=UPI0022800909|nr:MULTISPECIES: DMT family transporter [Bacillus]MCY7776069.1 DMT family transporter [Bacillus licheniformis]MCY7787291.1 DMT family transporter [Bacillus inaquosorum]MCY8020992.1 DMT family transporter [Bacillus licheniformis]MCY8076267.1 DMT family transporter [Bacillus haynesii]MCY8086011.1 DMT family transporter [Bacillus inaquosorum]